MPFGRPFLFCRYQLSVDGEPLSANAQFTLLQELQGRLVGRAESARYLDSEVMRPRRHTFRGQTAISFSVGHVIDKRVRAKYNKARDEIDLHEVEDGSVRFADFVALPTHGVLAVDDRSGDPHMGGKPALNRLRAIARMADAQFGAQFQATPQDFDRALNTWSLSSFKFIVRPNNPRPVSRLAQELSAQMQRDGIGTLNASAKPAPAGTIKVDGGIGAAAADLIRAGYGQGSLAGVTPDGQQAEIKRPQFDYDREINEQRQGKPRQLRVYVGDEDVSEDRVKSATVEALLSFYDYD